MKNQALFSSKDKSEKLKCRLLKFLFDALRVKYSKSATAQKPLTSKFFPVRVDPFQRVSISRSKHKFVQVN